MLEKEPSGALPNRTQYPQSQVVTPGGPFSRGQAPVVLNPSGPSYQYTLQFLIAVIKNSSSHRE